jgi:hypothetical protein
MPAPSFLSGLPKPVLFGLYGAIGGLLGALVFGEPLYRLLEPPKAQAAPPPEPQLAVNASPEVEVRTGGKNTFMVMIARDAFDDPVTVHFDRLPGGVTIEPVTIPKGATEGTATVVATSTATVAPAQIHVIAEASPGGKKISAETTTRTIVTEPSRGQADVFFVQDVTASMEWAIDGLRDGIGSFATYMRDNKIDFRVGLVAFRDLWIDQPSEVLKFRSPKGGTESFTSDDREFSNAVSKLRSFGGGDPPESVLDAVIEACDQPFRKGATKVLLIVTDNPPKNLYKRGGRTSDGLTAPPEDYDETVKKIKAADIDFVHLVLPTHVRVYTPLQNAGTGKGRTFDLAKVAANPNSFQSLVNDFSKDVVEAAKAKNPEGKPQVSARAEKPEIGVKAVQSTKDYAQGSEMRLALASAVWTGAIAALVCLTLLSGQHHYLRGTFPAVGGILAGLLGGLVVGLAGGAAGQGLYMVAQGGAVLAYIFQVVGWALLGGLAGIGLSLFIPNLKWVHGLAGGALGGAIGALGFIMVSSAAGDLVGRLVGGLLLGLCIGLMVAIVEAAFRRAWLEVRFGARETITVNLGPEPVKVGGDGRACTVWARGAPDIALRYYIRNGQVICEDAPNRTESVVANGDAREVGNVTVTVRTGASTAPSSPAPVHRAATPPRPASPPPARKPEPLDLGPLPLDEEPMPAPTGGLTPTARPASSAVPTSAAKPAAPTAPPAPPRPASPPPAAKPAAGPRDPDACPICGRKNPGRPGARFCMLCDQTY